MLTLPTTRDQPTLSTPYQRQPPIKRHGRLANGLTELKLPAQVVGERLARLHLLQVRQGPATEKEQERN